MYILIITFQLNGLSEQEYRQQCEASAPVFATLPGLLRKTWLANTATNTYGGVYMWNDRRAMEHYLRSDIYAGLVANPHFTNVIARDFTVLSAPTLWTWGQTEASLASEPF